MAQKTAAPIRVESELLSRWRVRPVAYVATNAQGFLERLVRRGGLIVSAPLRLLLDLFRPQPACRLRHALLRGVSRDRLEVLGEEYFARKLQRHLRPRPESPGKNGIPVTGVLVTGGPVTGVLVTGMPQQFALPLARALGIERVICNRLEFRDGRATGRLLEPIVSRPGSVDPGETAWSLSTLSSTAPPQTNRRVVLRFEAAPEQTLSVAGALAGRHILLTGGTGFIGKVFLAHLLSEIPGIGRVYLLVRPRGHRSGAQRFERLLRESPVLRPLDRDLVRAKVEIVEGDLCRPALGLDPGIVTRLHGELDLVVNSGGITEFNPDLRTALDTNVESTLHVAEFVAACSNAGLLHLSTCFVAGQRGGRVLEELTLDYNPAGREDFDAERERLLLHGLIRAAESRELNRRTQRTELARLGTERARTWGWPNTYTFTKSLAESLLAKRAPDLRLSIVRPSIVETSTREPFPGWNEGINTSAPLSYLLGTPFRQLPSNARKRLDIVPVDLVSRGMLLISAALVRREHRRVYQIASSVTNPCDMRRTIELTCLAHRKHDRLRPGLGSWWRRTCETVPVSKRRYRALSAPRQKVLVAALRRATPFARQLLRRLERRLDRVEKLIELYEPFILEDDHAFEADAVELLSATLSPDERDAFAYDTACLDWSHYWIDVHIPALRKWSYPLLEGRPVGE